VKRVLYLGRIVLCKDTARCGVFLPRKVSSRTGTRREDGNVRTEGRVAPTEEAAMSIKYY
jgi:hypothetical protein